MAASLPAGHVQLQTPASPNSCSAVAGNNEIIHFFLTAVEDEIIAYLLFFLFVLCFPAFFSQVCFGRGLQHLDSLMVFSDLSLAPQDLPFPLPPPVSTNFQINRCRSTPHFLFLLDQQNTAFPQYLQFSNISTVTRAPKKTTIRVSFSKLLSLTFYWTYSTVVCVWTMLLLVLNFSFTLLFS